MHCFFLGGGLFFPDGRLKNRGFPSIAWAHGGPNFPNMASRGKVLGGGGGCKNDPAFVDLEFFDFEPSISGSNRMGFGEAVFS